MCLTEWRLLGELVRQMAVTSKIPMSPAFLNGTRLDYQQRNNFIQLWYEISKNLIVNFDQTPLPQVCASKYTLEKKGTGSVPLVGKGKSKQITGTFAISQSGDFLPMQLIYERGTRHCLPQINFSKEFTITFTENHWSNEQKSIEFIQTIVLPFLKSKKVKLDLLPNQKSILILTYSVATQRKK